MRYCTVYTIQTARRIIVFVYNSKQMCKKMCLQIDFNSLPDTIRAVGSIE